MCGFAGFAPVVLASTGGGSEGFVGREVFGNIPFALEALFYVASAVFVGLASYLFGLRLRNWARGAIRR